MKKDVGLVVALIVLGFVIVLLAIQRQDFKRENSVQKDEIQQLVKENNTLKSNEQDLVTAKNHDFLNMFFGSEKAEKKIAWSKSLLTSNALKQLFPTNKVGDNHIEEDNANIVKSIDSYFTLTATGEKSYLNLIELESGDLNVLQKIMVKTNYVKIDRVWRLNELILIGNY
ncbi:hypothetical protein HBP99_13745 [Listeria booriae]|uniref:hypothetical protein n=1 Tax=Listeria booriae TaxID=1552123 RepID=UPI001627EB2D|nr:hypothetical protein [Listeria booriae]MBC2369705.1 hypothetical protein [Listeria booriae]